MPILETWARRSHFEYNGSIENGTEIIFGTGRLVTVTKEQYKALLKQFQGATVIAGTSRTRVPQGSIGKWLQINVTKTAIASYVCPILINEGYAERLDNGFIRFF